LSARTADRIALVTGAGQGLGRAVALALDAEGVAVALVGRTKVKLDDTLARMGGRGLAIAADITDPDQVRRAFATAEEALGGVDILVNCAAAYSPFPFPEASDHEITDMVAQSLTSALFCMREAIAAMRRRGGGDIVNISTQSTEMPQPFMAVYGAAKAGVETMTQGLRWELKGEDFRFIVCNVGSVADTVIDDTKPGFAKHYEAVQAIWAKTGIGPMYALPGTPPAGIAAAIVHAVTAPRDVYIQTLRLRGTELDAEADA
jgi:NADP-dependent 3-hydroxy acid dehydrogenase YdfG